MRFLRHAISLGTTAHAYNRRCNRAWFTLSIAVSLLHAIPAVLPLLRDAYAFQDDVRQHVFWMHRYVEPAAFPNDLIADYYESVAPIGYAALYKSLAAVGVNPLTASKILPVFLGAATVMVAFRFAFLLLRVPVGAFLASLFLSQALWSADDISSATPRAFVYLLLITFLIGVLQRSKSESRGTTLFELV